MDMRKFMSSERVLDGLGHVSEPADLGSHIGLKNAAFVEGDRQRAGDHAARHGTYAIQRFQMPLYLREAARAVHLAHAEAELLERATLRSTPALSCRMHEVR
jgi:hypothetical protein